MLINFQSLIEVVKCNNFADVNTRRDAGVKKFKNSEKVWQKVGKLYKILDQ